MLYFSPAFAFMAAGGILRFAAAASYGSRPVKAVLAGVVTVLFVAGSLPSIYSKKICPVYEFLQPVHAINSAKKYDFQLAYTTMASWLKTRTRPDETVAFYSGFDVRPETQYYLDSRDERDKPPQLLENLIAQGRLGVKSGRGFYTYPNPEYERPGWLQKQPPWTPSMATSLDEIT